jgi:hypothetical protein
VTKNNEPTRIYRSRWQSMYYKNITNCTSTGACFVVKKIAVCDSK